MASSDVQLNCGCGFTTRKLEAAAEHCDDRQHTMTVSGNVYPDKTLKPQPKVPSRTRRIMTVQVEVPEETSPLVDFAAMKRRIQKTQS